MFFLQYWLMKNPLVMLVFWVVYSGEWVMNHYTSVTDTVAGSAALSDHNQELFFSVRFLLQINGGTGSHG